MMAFIHWHANIIRYKFHLEPHASFLLPVAYIPSSEDEALGSRTLLRLAQQASDKTRDLFPDI
jgi:hypothetical protein